MANDDNEEEEEEDAGRMMMSRRRYCCHCRRTTTTLMTRLISWFENEETYDTNSHVNFRKDIKAYVGIHIGIKRVCFSEGEKGQTKTFPNL